MSWGEILSLGVVYLFVLGFIGLGGYLLWYWHKLGLELRLMAGTPTSRAADIAATPPGTIVEVKGPLRCAEPVTGEFSQKPSVYFCAHVEREIVSYTRDSKGRRQRTTRRETVHKNTVFAPCVVEDESGSVAISFEGAEVEGTETFKRFESSGSAGSLLGSLAGVGGETGRHLTETALPPDEPVYVLGTVQADHSIGPAPDRKAPYVISHKSEEARTKSLWWTRVWSLVGGIALVLLGLGIGIAVAWALMAPG